MPALIVQKFQQMVRVSAGTLGPPHHGAAPSPTDRETVDWLYSVLTILDSKAGALLAFDGLLLAAASLVYEKISEGSPILRTLALGTIAIALLAASLCLYVARVSYPFLGDITIGTFDNSVEIESLGRAAEARTTILSWAWKASVAAVVLFLFVMIMKLEGPL
jgi:hypothetical protein